jgi:hypothetical protein
VAQPGRAGVGKDRTRCNPSLNVHFRPRLQEKPHARHPSRQQVVSHCEMEIRRSVPSHQYTISWYRTPGSVLTGIDPMEVSVRVAQARGRDVTSTTLSNLVWLYDIISLINVFSHVANLRQFCSKMVTKVAGGMVLFIETGNSETKSCRNRLLLCHLDGLGRSSARPTDRCGGSREFELPVSDATGCRTW